MHNFNDSAYQFLLKVNKNLFYLFLLFEVKETVAESSPRIYIIVPVVIAVVIVVAMVSVYCIRRKRMERKVKKTISQSTLVSMTNVNYAYSGLEEDDSIEKLQDGVTVI